MRRRREGGEREGGEEKEEEEKEKGRGRRRGVEGGECERRG